MNVPVTFRGPNGPPTSVGAQHSQCFAAWLGSVPGLKVVAVSNADNAKGLLKAAIRDDNPTVVLESELLYNEVMPLSPEAQDPNFVIPIGRAAIPVAGTFVNESCIDVISGTDVTVVSFSRQVNNCIKAANKLREEGINVEVVDLQTIRPLDVATIVASVQKTGRCVTVEEGWTHYGVGAEITAQLVERTHYRDLFIYITDAFDYLDAPVERVTGADVPMPYSKSIEDLAMVQVDHIISAIKRCVNRK